MTFLHVVLVLFVAGMIGVILWVVLRKQDAAGDDAEAGDSPVQLPNPQIAVDDESSNGETEASDSHQTDTEPPPTTIEPSLPAQEGEVPQVRESLTSETTQRLAEMVSEFPPLPFNTTSILAEMRGKNANTKKIVSLVGQDPVLSAAVLRMANSAFYAQENEVTSIDRGVLLLGHDAVLSVALRGALTGLVTGSVDGGYDGNALLRHNVVTGLWAGAVARRCERVDPGEAVTAGLLHDLGKVALNAARPDEVRAILDPVTSQLGESRLAKEQRLVGATHAVLGALLCSQWKIPATLVDTIELHHHPAVTSLDGVSPRIRELTAVVFVANQMAKYSGCHGDDMEIDLPTGTLLASLGLPGTLDQVHEEMLPQVQRSMQAFLGGTGVQQEEAITT